jgi:hypothetical protein
MFRIFGVLLLLALPAMAQQAGPLPSLAPSVTATATVIVTSPPVGATSPSASPTPSLLKTTGVKLMFIPPPMQGTISLGIYDSSGKLVRVLHREAGSDEFVAALDGYITHWDGLDDGGNPMPPRHYTARGYMVGDVTVQPVPWPAPSVSATTGTAASAATPGPPFTPIQAFVPQVKIRVGLVGNPLDRDRAGSADVSVGFDPKGSWLQLADGLPLKQISATPNLKAAFIGRSAPGQPLVIIQTNGTTLQEFVITKVSNMVAFDCGAFDFKGPGQE